MHQSFCDFCFVSSFSQSKTVFGPPGSVEQTWLGSIFKTKSAQRRFTSDWPTVYITWQYFKTWPKICFFQKIKSNVFNPLFVHQEKGQPDSSTYAQEKGCLKCYTICETPTCSTGSLTDENQSKNLGTISRLEFNWSSTAIAATCWARNYETVEQSTSRIVDFSSLSLRPSSTTNTTSWLSPLYRVYHELCDIWYTPFLGHILTQQAVLSCGDRALRLDFLKKNLQFFFRSGSGPGTSSAWFSGSAWFTASSSSLQVVR